MERFSEQECIDEFLLRKPHLVEARSLCELRAVVHQERVVPFGDAGLYPAVATLIHTYDAFVRCCAVIHHGYVLVAYIWGE
jgi:hypothetical protein